MRKDGLPHHAQSGDPTEDGVQTFRDPYHSVEAGWGNPPTIAHVPEGIVHGLPLAEALLEKVPFGGNSTISQPLDA